MQGLLGALLGPFHSRIRHWPWITPKTQVSIAICTLPTPPAIASSQTLSWTSYYTSNCPPGLLCLNRPRVIKHVLRVCSALSLLHICQLHDHSLSLGRYLTDPSPPLHSHEQEFRLLLFLIWIASWNPHLLSHLLRVSSSQCYHGTSYTRWNMLHNGVLLLSC